MSAVVRWTGPLATLTPADHDALCRRAAAAVDPAVRGRVAEIVAQVRDGGDAALRALALELDHVALDAIEVPRERRVAALAALDPAVRAALERAARNIDAFHRAGRLEEFLCETEPGILVGRRPDPLGVVGVYAPGGRATYPSTVLMCAIPARAAGVRRIVLCSPTGPDGVPAPAVLAAAELAGVDHVFAIGGAGAIAAMAYGTTTVPRVDRIVGPGNRWVTEAKLQVTHLCSIDSPAGPSELLVVADDTAKPDSIAREMFAQAEHDPDACVVALAPEPIATAVLDALATGLPLQQRRDIIEAALARNGAVLTAPVADALTFAAEYAPEHLLLAVDDPLVLLENVRNAGTIVCGTATSVAFGDYATGANHTLPTGGLARSYSGLSTADFVRWTTWQTVMPDAATALAADVAKLAIAEGLPAHAAAAHAFVWEERRTRRARRPPMPQPAQRALAALAWLSRDPSARPPVEIELGDNTNLFGAPPAAAHAVRDTGTSHLAGYPTPHADELRNAIATLHDVPAPCVITGCGSDGVLDAALRAYGSPRARVVYHDPTFSMVPRLAAHNRLHSVPVACPGPLTAVTVDALFDELPAILYLCSPNNPTGARMGPDVVEAVRRRLRERQTPPLVILDQAYAEFDEGDAPQRFFGVDEPVLVMRTMSKAYGLAGLRVGYGIAPRPIVVALETMRGPYAVGAAAERAAVQALTEDRSWMRGRVALMVGLRRRLFEALRERGFSPLRSAANFVLVPVEDAHVAERVLRRHDVGVRAFHGLAGIGDAVRITVGPWPMLERCLEAMVEVPR